MDGAKLSYTIDEAAAAIGVSRRTIYHMVHDEELSTFKWRGRTLIRADVLQAAMDRKHPPKPPIPKPGMPSKPKPPACGVYMLVLADEVVYVGRSTALQSRLASHRTSGRRFDVIRVIPCDQPTSVWLERELIRTLRPSQNLMRYARHAASADRELAGLAS